MKNQFATRRFFTNMTQEEVAKKLGVSSRTLYFWEHGKGLPKAALLPKIAELYNCTIDDLFREPMLTKECVSCEREIPANSKYCCWCAARQPIDPNSF